MEYPAYALESGVEIGGILLERNYQEQRVQCALVIAIYASPVTETTMKKYGHKSMARRKMETSISGCASGIRTCLLQLKFLTLETKKDGDERARLMFELD